MQAPLARKNRSRWILLSAFLATLFLIGWVWWPLVKEYVQSFNPLKPWFGQIDWLLIGIFMAMTFLIMSRADLRADGGLILVSLVGGFAIESWGTQTGLWSYYTGERPPLWILPAWPIATLSIERIVRAVRARASAGQRRRYAFVKGVTMGAFLVLMIAFVRPYLDHPATIAALALSAGLVLLPSDPREFMFTFAAGAGLGLFLEIWGTTRGCWNYYTLETPPLFAVLAHGMAAVAFARGLEVVTRTRPLWSRFAVSGFPNEGGKRVNRDPTLVNKPRLIEGALGHSSGDKTLPRL